MKPGALLFCDDNRSFPPILPADLARPPGQRSASISLIPASSHRDALLKSEFNANAKVDIGRFKGLGEMMPAQLKETTMDPAKRTMLKVVLLADDRDTTADSVERLMGTKAEARFAFISDKAEFANDDLLDV